MIPTSGPTQAHLPRRTTSQSLLPPRHRSTRRTNGPTSPTLLRHMDPKTTRRVTNSPVAPSTHLLTPRLPLKPPNLLPPLLPHNSPPMPVAPLCLLSLTASPSSKTDRVITAVKLALSMVADVSQLTFKKRERFRMSHLLYVYNCKFSPMLTYCLPLQLIPLASIRWRQDPWHSPQLQGICR